MMENKYYVPEIEEFCVGFECEWQPKIRNETWNKQICDVDLVNIAYDAFEHADYEESFEEQFRVKYLDQEDIEECGFVYKGKDTAHNFIKPIGEVELEDGCCCDYLLYIRFRPNLNNLRIIKVNHHDSTTDIPIDVKTECIFSGKIKNKTEFKKILKMLEI